MTGFSKNRRRLEAVTRQARDTQATLARVVDPRSARLWIGVSQSGMGDLVGQVHPNGRNGKPFSRKTVSNIELGRYVVPYQRQIYEHALAGQLQSETEGALTIKLQGSPKRFRVTLYRQCDCGRYFKLTRINMIRCPSCRK